MFKFIASFLCACALILTTTLSHAEDKKTLLGDWNLGATVGAGVPSPISGQVLVKYKKVIGLNAEYGFLPTLTLPGGDNIQVSQHMADFGLHVYPFKGAFFLGCGMGFQNLSASATTTQQVQGQSVTGQATASVDTVFVSPRLGFLHRFDFGLAIGMDVGVQIPVSGSTTISGSADGVALTPPKGATDVAHTIQTTPIPIIHLLQLGWVL